MYLNIEYYSVMVIAKWLYHAHEVNIEAYINTMTPQYMLD